MIGVVVWASEAREKAIIWCEDQATLAYLQGRSNLLDPHRAWPMPGDLVELESETIGSLRHARSVALISEQCCPDLPRMLGSAASSAGDAVQLRVVSSSDLRHKPQPACSDAPCAYPRSGAAG